MLSINEPLNISGDLKAFDETLKKAWEDSEGKRVAYDVNEEMRYQLIAGRKFNLLRNQGFYALLEDLLKEAKEEYERRRVSPPLNSLNFLGYVINGIEAGISRYKQLYQSMTS